MFEYRVLFEKLCFQIKTSKYTRDWQSYQLVASIKTQIRTKLQSICTNRKFLPNLLENFTFPKLGGAFSPELAKLRSHDADVLSGSNRISGFPWIRCPWSGE